jgi:hypothetical protein
MKLEEMTPLTILPELEGQLGEYKGRLGTGRIAVLGALSGGMASGKPSVGMVVETPAGPFYCETSLSLLLMAADILKARHGDPRTDDEPKGGA